MRRGGGASRHCGAARHCGATRVSGKTDDADMADAGPLPRPSSSIRISRPSPTAATAEAGIDEEENVDGDVTDDGGAATGDGRVGEKRRGRFPDR